MANSSYLKPFLTSTSTTLTINGNPIKKPSKYWNKKGQADGFGGWISYWVYDTGTVLANPGDTMTIVFHLVATKTFSDGFTTYNPGDELMPGPNCTLHAV